MLESIEDQRIHCLLYFLEGHHVKGIDMKAILKLQQYVNIIPIVAKADTYTQEELEQHKLNIVTEAEDRGIKFFDCSQAVDHLFEVRITNLR